ncbi:hypothetical protein [Methanoculleus bourgensis]|nr:hypothetical protein [Methanoculleus bourgensis]
MPIVSSSLISRRYEDLDRDINYAARDRQLIAAHPSIVSRRIEKCRMKVLVRTPEGVEKVREVDSDVSSPATS